MFAFTVDDTQNDERPVCILRFSGATDAMLSTNCLLLSRATANLFLMMPCLRLKRWTTNMMAKTFCFSCRSGPHPYTSVSCSCHWRLMTVVHPTLLVVRLVILYFLSLFHDCFIYGIASESAFITGTTNLIGLELSQKTVLSLHYFLYVYLSTNVPALEASNMTLQKYDSSTRLALISSHDSQRD